MKPEIIIFKSLSDFIRHNKTYIDDNYIKLYPLVVMINKVRTGELKVFTAFNVICGKSGFIMCVGVVNVGCLIYGENWTKEAINALYKNIPFDTITHFSFSGEREIIFELFDGNSINYEVDKDRLTYQCTKTSNLNLSSGKAVKSQIDDYDQIVKMSYDYSLEEWGEREGRDINYYKRNVLTLIQHQCFCHWIDNGKIVSMLQVMNLTDNIPIIGSFFTAKQSRGKGYGTSLLHEVTASLLESGFEVCGLASDAKNVVSNKLFQKIGYECIGKAITVIANPEKL
jgi:hypothetical protein